MAISIDFTMFDMTNPKLSKSADALESALAQLSKNVTPFAVNTDDAHNFLGIPAAVSNNGSGFDEWLANDFQLGALSSDDLPSSLSSSPYSALDDSPDLGFDSYSAMMGPSLFDMNLGFPVNNDLMVAPVASPVVAAAPVQAKAAPSMLTTAVVQEAAAALNIPWSHDLELAVMAQAQMTATSSLSALPTNNVRAIIIPKQEPIEQSIISPPSHVASAFEPSQANGNQKRALSPEEDVDEVVAKRAKNTDAARRSRLKKLVRLETLETKVTELEATNNRLNMKVAILETQKTGHLVKEAEQSTRIAQLEAKLAEAHAALTSRA